MPLTLQERIDRHTWRRKGRLCWPWLGHIDKWGNARIWVDKKTGSITVQRAIYLLKHSTIPKGYEAISCPVLKDCANPYHIGIATKREIGDRILWRKGQRRPQKRPPSRMSDEEVRQIYLSEDDPTKLADYYRISVAHVINIKAGRKFPHITQFERKQDASN